MSRSHILPLVSAFSLGAGGIIGVCFERSKTRLEPSGSGGEGDDGINPSYGKYYIPLPTVGASSAPISGVPSLLDSVDLMINPSASNRVSEIMKHGFPSLDNIRTYQDYVLAYDKRNRTAFWVFEHLTKDKVKRIEGIEREKSSFEPDTSIHQYFRATNEDYKNSGYDRGHLAAAGNHRFSQKAMDETFYLSNISPQIGKGFNRDAWNNLEKFVRHLTKNYLNVYVCTGPLYLPMKDDNGKLYVKYEVIGKNHVAVPTHFFKVILCETMHTEKELLSFVMPNQELPHNVDLKNYLVPVETIERASGLLLFDKIPKKMFSKINGKAT